MAKKKKKSTTSEQLADMVKFVNEIKDQIESNGTAVVDIKALGRIKKMLCGTPGNPCP
jgi:hypothetical protein